MAVMAISTAVMLVLAVMLLRMPIRIPPHIVNHVIANDHHRRTGQWAGAQHGSLWWSVRWQLVTRMRQRVDDQHHDAIDNLHVIRQVGGRWLWPCREESGY